MDKRRKNQGSYRARYTTSYISMLHDERGVISIVFASMLIVFIGSAALAIDLSYAQWTRNNLQTAASAAAHAGAVALAGNAISRLDANNDGLPDEAPELILNVALELASENYPGSPILAKVDVVPGNWVKSIRLFTPAGFYNAAGVFTACPTDPRCGGRPPISPLNAVQVTTRRAEVNNNPLGLFFAPTLGLAEININTVAIATSKGGGPIPTDACILALSPDDPDAFKIFGNADVQAKDCEIWINSENVCAFSANGDPTLFVNSEIDGGIYIVGDQSGGGVCTTAGVDEISPWPQTCDEPPPGWDEVTNGACTVAIEATADPYENYEELPEVTQFLAPNLDSSACGAGLEGVDLDNDGIVGDGTTKFMINGQKFVQLQTDAGGNLIGPPYLDAIGNVVDPVNDSNGNDIIIGTKAVTNLGDWTYNLAAPVLELGGEPALDPITGAPATVARFEFHMIPGTYCGGIEARGDGTVVFADGIYVLRGDRIKPEEPNPSKQFTGEFDIRAKVALEGHNVAFVLNGVEAFVNMGGSANVQLSGRAEAPLQGFLFYSDQYATGAESPSGGHLFRGTPGGGYEGVLYFPTGDVVFKGTANGDLDPNLSFCTVLIADTVYFNGTTGLSTGNACPPDFLPVPGLADLLVRLVN